jgi:hypothetical protein
MILALSILCVNLRTAATFYYCKASDGIGKVGSLNY